MRFRGPQALKDTHEGQGAGGQLLLTRNPIRIPAPTPQQRRIQGISPIFQQLPERERPDTRIFMKEPCAAA